MNKFELEKYVKEVEKYFESEDLELLVEDINFIERIIEQAWIAGYQHHMYESEYERNDD